MFNNLGPTHPKATETDVDDVQGHRIDKFIEDEKDARTGPLSTDTDDVEGHFRVLCVDDAPGEPTDTDDVEGHFRVLC